jgi:hypothetical protein
VAVAARSGPWAPLRAAAVFVAPAILFAGFALHPSVSNPTDAEAIADAVVADTTRWGVAHLAAGVGFALMVLAFIAIRSYLRDAGEERWSSKALPLAAVGSALFVILPGLEFAPLAAAETGGDVEGAQEELLPWFLPVFAVATVAFSLGALGFALAIARSGRLSKQLARLVVGALIVMVAARFVPLFAAQIVVGLAAVVALWPLAYAMWRDAAG